ncbi:MULTISPECIES: enoyl-CoA hydratase/isomerase family protein [Paenibacillus]|uniref:Enoyl-CoA hydratase n=2 Tax=Paenibacillus TaxID=44249 RepID=A0A3N9P581_9BACL|nr:MULTISPECIES: enoyl-CoA hydratase-related protein [Paenibacillus]AHV95659.1 enoyl-CoA hydratase/isomerase [Paenibacillus sabinae T27]RQW10570.1 enoyl-CoA hydratase [Paenibacillus rhizophilus]
MREDQQIYVRKDGDIATIVLNRPERRNAISLDMWHTLYERLIEVERDEAVKAVIIRSDDDKAFSAGADIGEFTSVRASSASAKLYNAAAHRAEDVLARLNKPTIAMIRGYCIGAGCELSLVCDFRFADTSAAFAITPAKLGMVYNLFGMKYLVRQVGPSNAKDILYSARRVAAEEALRMRLIDRLFEPDRLEDEVYAYARMLSQNSQLSIKGTKRIIHEIMDGMTEENEEISALVLSSFDGPDYIAGIEAFLNKKVPEGERGKERGH